MNSEPNNFAQRTATNHLKPLIAQAQSALRHAKSWLASRRRRVVIGAFGKHPSRNEHLAPFPETDPAIDHFHRDFQLGIETNVGRWRELQQAGNAIPYGHFALVRTKDQFLIARFWPSRDNIKPKPRTDYPMVGYVLARGVPLPQLLAASLPSLRTLGAAIAATEDHDTVLAAIDTADGSIKSGIEQAQLQNGHADTADTTEQFFLSELLANPRFGSSQEKLMPFLSDIEEFLSSDRPAAYGAFAARVPACLSGVADTMRAWIALLDVVGASHHPVTLFIPDTDEWVDLFVGTPSASQYVCLRASQKEEPLSTAKPLSQALDNQAAKAMLSELRTVAGLATEPSEATIPFEKNASSEKGPNLKEPSIPDELEPPVSGKTPFL